MLFSLFLRFIFIKTSSLSATYLLNVVDQWVAILLPVGLERLLTGELVTAELQSDLKAVAAEVVEILHSWIIKHKSIESEDGEVFRVKNYILLMWF